MAASLGKEIRTLTESQEYDLKNYTQEQALELATVAFADPLKLDKMIRVTFAVGAGKLNRARYDDDLPKWLSAGLKEVGFEDDRGASLSFECAGTYKFQHDTGKNMKYVHVFPKVVEQEEEAPNGEDNQNSYLPLDARWLCVASEMETFKKMVAAKMPSWIERRRCSHMLAEQIELLQQAVNKLSRLEALDPIEQRLFDAIEPELVHSKIEYLAESMKELFDSGHLSKVEIRILSEQIDAKMKALETEKEGAKLEKAKQMATARKEKLESLTPFVHELKNVKNIIGVWRKLRPMEALLEKAGPKGRWSGKLSASEVDALGEREELIEEEASLLAAARHWFEDDDEFIARVERAKASMPAIKKKAPASSKPADGWNTVGTAKNVTGKSSNSNKTSGGGAFAALG